MLTNHGQVAGHKALSFSFHSKAKQIASTELKKFSDFLRKFKQDNRRKFNYPRNSILFYALSSNDFKNEDILSESILLLDDALKTYEEKIREVEFAPYAITFIREGLKSLKSKNNHTNSSDQNELIHSAIRYIKKNNHHDRLTHEQILKLINHFKLDQIKGYKKIVEFENIQKGTICIERNKTEDNSSYNILDDNKFENYEYIYNYSKNFDIEKIFEAPQTKKIRTLILNFIKDLNKKEKNIFVKRIFNSKEKFICLKNIAIKYQITPQAINKIENKLKKKFYHYLKIKIVDNQLTAVK